MGDTRRLHIGGTVRVQGWEVLNAIPGPHVDHVGNANDMSPFADDAFAAIYASHIVEHLDYMVELGEALAEWNRVLEPGGELFVSVPDLDVLASLFIARDRLTVDERFHVMRMIFGGHVNQFDYHVVGLNQEFLTGFLRQAGFAQIERVPEFGMFDDTSSLRFKGELISVNLKAVKPGRSAA